MHSTNRVIQRGCDLITTYNQKYVRRTMAQTCHTITTAVNIDKFSVDGDGIGAHKEIVREYGTAV